jgi:hypothetical protein
MLLLACVAARADNPYGYIFTVAPNPVPTGNAISVTIETVGVPCVALAEELGTVLEDGGILYLSVPGSDACDAAAQETRNYTIDALPPGQYFFRFYSCGGLDAETNEPACMTLEEIPVMVLGVAAQRRTIPALSTTGLVVLGFVAIGLAALFRPR